MPRPPARGWRTRIGVVAGIGDVDVAGGIDREAGRAVELGSGGEAAVAGVAWVPLPAMVEMMPEVKTLRTRVAVAEVDVAGGVDGDADGAADLGAEARTGVAGDSRGGRCRRWW